MLHQTGVFYKFWLFHKIQSRFLVAVPSLRQSSHFLLPMRLLKRNEAKYYLKIQSFLLTQHSIFAWRRISWSMLACMRSQSLATFQYRPRRVFAEPQNALAWTFPAYTYIAKAFTCKPCSIYIIYVCVHYLHERARVLPTREDI